MSPEERHFRDAAARFRAANPTSWQHLPYMAAQAARLDFEADLLALRGLDLSDLFRPTAGDALALRGEG